jgi:hypothetical protein
MECLVEFEWGRVVLCHQPPGGAGFLFFQRRSLLVYTPSSGVTPLISHCMLRAWEKAPECLPSLANESAPLYPGVLGAPDGQELMC